MNRKSNYITPFLFLMKWSFVFLLIIKSNFLFGQNSGSISGKVIDEQSGELIIGAKVRLITNVNLETITNKEGFFFFKDVKEKNSTIEITAPFFQPKIIKDIVLSEKENTKVDVFLNPSNNVLKEVVLNAKSRRNTESSVLLERMKIMASFDGISSQAMSKTGSSDAGDALKRIPGVSMNGGKDIFVRGMGSRYNLVTMNGVLMPGLDPNNNSVQPDLFPVFMIDNIKVYKTASPDLPAIFSGGYIDITTKDIPNKAFFTVSTSLGYNNQATFNNNFLTFNKGKTAWLGFDDGTRSIPFYDQKNLNSLMESLDIKSIAKITKEYNSKIDLYKSSPLPNFSINTSYGNSCLLFGKKMGYIVSGLYSNRNTFYDDGMVGKYTLGQNINSATQLIKTFDFDETRAENNTFLNGLMGLSYDVSSRHKINYLGMYSHSAETLAVYREGYSNETQNNYDGNTSIQSRQDYTERDLFSNQLNYKGRFSENFPLKIEASLSYSKAFMKVPDLRVLLASFREENGNKIYSYYTKNDQFINRSIRSLKEENYFSKIDLTFPAKLFSIKTDLKVGGLMVLKDRVFRDNRVSYWDSQSLGGDVYGYNGSIEHYLGNVYEGGKDTGVYIRNAYEAKNNYDATEFNWASYGMFTAHLEGNWKLLSGARVEATKVNLTSLKTDLLLNDKLLENRIDILPSIILTKEFSGNKILKFSASKTINRPSLVERSPVSMFDNIQNLTFNGNPNLKLATILNYDIRYEWFQKNAQLFAFTLFYKDLNNPIELTDISTTEEPILTPRNVSKAKVYGLELEIRKNLGFLNERLEQFDINFNGTLMDSKVEIDAQEYANLLIFDKSASKYRPLFFQSPWILNTSFNYNSDKIECAIALNIQGKNISFVTSGATPDVYLLPRPDLNFSFQYKLSKEMKINFQAINFMNSKFVNQSKFLDSTYDNRIYSSGAVFKIGFTYSI